MKKILLAAMSIVFLTTASFAQQASTVNANQQGLTVNDEHLIMKNGKMYHSLNGKEMIMENPMTLHNSTVMHSDGSYQLKNGKNRQLRNGHCMDMNGKKYRSHQMYQKSMMRMHGSGMHSGSHQGMNMNGHH
jgi:opacity protein-like surface antigen